MPADFFLKEKLTGRKKPRSRSSVQKVRVVRKTSCEASFCQRKEEEENAGYSAYSQSRAALQLHRVTQRLPENGLYVISLAVANFSG